MGNPGVAVTDGRPSGVLPMKNRFTVSRTGEMGVKCLPFSKSKRKFRLNRANRADIQFVPVFVGV
jgi:hypothetical protein